MTIIPFVRDAFSECNRAIIRTRIRVNKRGVFPYDQHDITYVHMYLRFFGQEEGGRNLKRQKRISDDVNYTNIIIIMIFLFPLFYLFSHFAMKPAMKYRRPRSEILRWMTNDKYKNSFIYRAPMKMLIGCVRDSGLFPLPLSHPVRK